MDELSQDISQVPVDEGQNMAQQSPELTPEEAKASLGLSTRLSEQFLMSQVPQEDMGGQPEEAIPKAPQASESEPEPKVDEEPVDEEKDAEMESMRTDIELLKKAVIGDDKEVTKEE